MLVAKYDPLHSHLSKAGNASIEMQFDAVARLVGGLPRSAFIYREWWANESSRRHVQCRAWMATGRRVEFLDLQRQVVRFSAPYR